MPLAEGKERIYVTVSDDMAARIDYYRKKMGLSRSAFCGYMVGQGVMSLDKAMGIVDAMGDTFTAKVVNEVSNGLETMKQLESTADQEQGQGDAIFV